MSAFTEIKLAEALIFQRGFDITKAEQTEGAVPIISSSGISSYHSRSKVKGPGVVIGRKGTLGTVHYAADDYWPHDTTLWVKDFKGNDPRFVYYFLQTLKLENFDVGASNPTLNRNHLHNIKVVVPHHRIQKKIAAILSAYDDLIENNKRRIALLEKTAEEIYREWFVRMRFPGHEKTKFVKGVPAGWRVAELGEVALINPSSMGKNDRPETIQYVDIGSVTTDRVNEISTLTFSEAPGRARRRVRHGDTIWSTVRPGNRAYCLLYEPPEDLIVSTGFAVVRPKEDTPFTFLKFAVTSDVFVDQMTSVAKGSAYPATSFEDFEKAKLLVPNIKMLNEFHRRCEPMFRQRYVVSQQNDLLEKSRNLLLPRLISGKLSVEDLDIQFPPSMREEAEMEASKAEPIKAEVPG